MESRNVDVGSFSTGAFARPARGTVETRERCQFHISLSRPSCLKKFKVLGGWLEVFCILR